MRTFRKVKGAPIFLQNKNRFIGRISDLVLSNEEAKVMGYWLFTRKWWSKHHFVPIEDIAQRDREGLYVFHGTELKPLPKNARRFCEGKDRLSGNLLHEYDGDTIGLIEDVYFLPDSGKIVGYELTEGLFSDIQKGIKMVKQTTPLLERERSFFIQS